MGCAVGQYPVFHCTDFSFNGRHDDSRPTRERVFLADCTLPPAVASHGVVNDRKLGGGVWGLSAELPAQGCDTSVASGAANYSTAVRSEERRVGIESRLRLSSLYLNM